MSEKTSTSTTLKFRRTLARIDVDEIVPNDKNPREPISKTEVNDIRESIRNMRGVLVPIVVYRRKEDGKYVLLDGERRWRACKDLAKKDEFYRHIPANIIEEPLSDIQNLQTMFNIHQKRKDWSTAAIAEAIGRLLELKGDLNVGQLMELTGLENAEVSDALLLLKFPPDVRKRCLEGELDEFYPILLGQNLKALGKVFPSLFEGNNSWQYIAERFLKKVDEGYIRRARDFHRLGRLARKCIQYQSESLFESVFQRMIEKAEFTPRDAEGVVETELDYKLESSFKNTSTAYLGSLKSYLRSRSTKAVPNETMDVLVDIYHALKDFISQTTLLQQKR
jgi:ParB family chromosome partitioning protein